MKKMIATAAIVLMSSSAHAATVKGGVEYWDTKVADRDIVLYDDGNGGEIVRYEQWLIEKNGSVEASSDWQRGKLNYIKEYIIKNPVVEDAFYHSNEAANGALLYTDQYETNGGTWHEADTTTVENEIVSRTARLTLYTGDGYQDPTIIDLVMTEENGGLISVGSQAGEFNYSALVEHAAVAAFTEGWDQGYEEGYDDGYSDGFSDGFQAGKEFGGYNEGFDHGYKQGIKDSQ